MHDPEKSNSGIVAMKPMNKAGRPAAELAEPSRARVTQALDRVRKAARQSKKEQFTSLVHHIERAVPLAFPPSAQLRLSDNDFSGSPQPTPTSSQRNTSGRAGSKRLKYRPMYWPGSTLCFAPDKATRSNAKPRRAWMA